MIFMDYKKLFYGILVFCILAILGIGSFMYLNKPVLALSKNQIIIKQSGGAAALLAECVDRNYISNISDYIIEGTVEKVESNWKEGSIFTYSDIRIEKYIKGDRFAENKLQIVTSGGTVGEISQGVEDQPIFHEGKKIRIYLQETDKEFSIVCAYGGVEEIL